MKKAFHDEGIVIRKRPVREKDEVVVIFCKNLGKKAFVSYGSRDPKSKKSGILELFNTIYFSAREQKGRMAVIEQVKMLKSRAYALFEDNKDLNEYYRASALLNLLNKSIDDEQKAEGLYQDANTALDALFYQAIVPAATIRFWDDLGYLPQWSLCLECGEKLDLEKPIFFSSANRGFIQHNCQKKLNYQQDASIIQTDPQLVKVMAFLQKSSLHEAIKVTLAPELLSNLETTLSKMDVHEGA